MLDRMAQQQILEVVLCRWLNVQFQGDFGSEDGAKSQEDQQERLLWRRDPGWKTLWKEQRAEKGNGDGP